MPVPVAIFVIFCIRFMITDVLSFSDPAVAPANVSTGASSESAGAFKSHLPRPQALGRSSSGSSSTSTSGAAANGNRDTAEDDDGDDDDEDDDLLDGVISSGLPKSRYDCVTSQLS